MTLSTRSGLTPSTSKSSSLRSKQASDVLNATAAFNASLSSFITLAIFFWEEISLLQAHDEDFQDTLSDDNHQKNINDHIKLIGGFATVVFSIAASIAWLVHWRRRSADPTFNIATELDKQKDRANPWARRYLTGSVPGYMLGQAVGDVAGQFLPRPFAKVLKTAASALLGVITGIAAMVIFSDGENLRSEKSLFAKFLDGKDGWTRSLKIYVPLGGAIGAAIGASLGLLIFGPAGVIIGAAIGSSLGWLTGIGIYLLRNRLAKSKAAVVMDGKDIITANQITQNLPKVLTNVHVNKLYLLRVADRVNKKTNEPYKILLYRSLTPSGRTKTALLKIGLSNDCDIKHDVTTPFDLYALDNKVKNDILKIASKRGHIPPICAADSKDRTKQRRVGLGLGSVLGGLIGIGAGYGLSFVFPIFAVAIPGTVGVLTLGPFLFGAIAAALFMVAGYYFMKHIGPKISAWINPDDYIENSYEYCIATGQGVAKAMVGGAPGLVHKFSDISNNVDDAITNASSIIGAGIGVACGIYEGRKQNARLLKKLSKNTLPVNDPDKELVDAEIEHKFAAKFNANKKITTATQSIAEFTKYGGPVCAFIGALIGNAIFPIIGGLAGGAIGGFVGVVGGKIVAYKWGDQIYGRLIKGANWLVNKVHGLLTKKVHVETAPSPTIDQSVSDEIPLLRAYNLKNTDSSLEDSPLNAAAEDIPSFVAAPALVPTAGLVAPPPSASAAGVSLIIDEPDLVSVPPLITVKSPRVVRQQSFSDSDDDKPSSTSSSRSTSPKIGAISAL